MQHRCVYERQGHGFAQIGSGDDIIGRPRKQITGRVEQDSENGLPGCACLLGNDHTHAGNPNQAIALQHMACQQGTGAPDKAHTIYTGMRAGR